MRWTAEHVKRMLTNPFYCLRNIDERLVGEHEPLISEEKFIAGGVRLIRKLGPEEYLRELLENLKGHFVSNDDVDDDAAALGYRRT